MYVLLAALFAISSAWAAEPVRPPCPDCAKWNEPQQPFKVYGNTYYVGPHGLSSVLITSKDGHVLIDGGLPQSAERIAANIKTLGFRLEDVKLIVNSHVHYDHAGGIAELQKLSGASVAASPSTAEVLKRGYSGSDDPQFGILPPIKIVPTVKVLQDGETLRVGSLAVTAHFTPGHTPGGTSWSWQSCEEARCLNMVYADSLTPVSAPGFKFASIAKSFESSYAVLSTMPCDILITPHPDASGLWDRVANPVDPNACRAYVERGRANLEKRLATERTQ
jgi:metallo-beta-lactamase class B